MTNLTIINTRPKNIQQHSNQLFREAGFDVVELPCIEIIGNAEHKVKQQLESIEADDVVIFTSQFAVQFAFKIFKNFNLSHSNTVITVGTKTAEILEQNSSVSIWTPEKQNSEGVIEILRSLKKPQKINLITAVHGRDEIQSYAQKKKISLQQINVYKRVLPKVNDQIIESLEQLSRFQTLATSVTTLKNLKQILPTKIWKKFQLNQLICASERIEKQAVKLGFEKTTNLGSANIEFIIETLINPAT